MAQPVREGQSDSGMHLNLVYAVELVFNRIFDCQYLLLGRIGSLQRRIERGRLAAACRTRGQNHPVRNAYELIDPSESAREQTDLLEGVVHRGPVKQPQHHALTVECGHGRYPDVYLAACDSGLDSAVLRQSSLGDVQVGHDLQARDYRGLEALRWRGYLVQYAVDSIPDLGPSLERLDVNVAGSLLDGLAQDQIDQLDDRGLLGHAFQVADLVC